MHKLERTNKVPHSKYGSLYPSKISRIIPNLLFPILFSHRLNVPFTPYMIYQYQEPRQMIFFSNLRLFCRNWRFYDSPYFLFFFPSDNSNHLQPQYTVLCNTKEIKTWYWRILLKFPFSTAFVLVPRPICLAWFLLRSAFFCSSYQHLIVPHCNPSNQCEPPNHK